LNLAELIYSEVGFCFYTASVAKRPTAAESQWKPLLGVIDGASVATRPKPVTGPHAIVALKQPFTACSKLPFVAQGEMHVIR